jgi:hypothetical protein
MLELVPLAAVSVRLPLPRIVSEQPVTRSQYSSLAEETLTFPVMLCVRVVVSERTRGESTPTKRGEEDDDDDNGVNALEYDVGGDVGFEVIRVVALLHVDDGVVAGRDAPDGSAH